ncbi:hypothetical protein B0H34DRAFT_293504 [Crassisporium funariophilum]|nr:hypothetical protein B0H34DRAFT_293504 [Crassisporium funariophilum]
MSAVASVHEGFKKQSASGSKSPRTKHERMNSVSSGVSESNRDSVAEPERIVAKKETLISSFKGIAQQLIVGKRPTGLGLVTLPVHKVWTTTPTHEGKTQEHQQRLTRLAEGREAVLFSTEAERASVLRRFKEEICETPLRQKMYRDAIQSAVNDGMELDMTKAHFSYDYEESAKVVVQPSSTSLDPEPSDSGSSSGKMPMSPRPISIPPGQVEAVDDEGAAFVQEMELAMKLSLEEYNRG